MLNFLAALFPKLLEAGVTGVKSIGSNVMNTGRTLGSMIPGTMDAASKAAVQAGTASQVPLGYQLGNTAGAVGDFLGGKTLGNLMMNPSMKTLGAFGKEQVLPSLLTGQSEQPTQQQQLSPGAIDTKQKLSTSEPEIDDPILKRMYQNLNQQQGFQAPTMQSWGPSPYPKKMSSV